MRADPDAIAAIRVKVARAQQHFIMLRGEMAQFTQQQPWSLTEEVHANGAKHVFRFRLSRPLPASWSVVLGEAIHDLRSALDHAVYQLTIDHSGRPMEGTQFPVLTSSARYHQLRSRGPLRGQPTPTSGLHLVRGVGPGPAAYIERLQPYPQRRSDINWTLRALHDFWNQDKHRLVHMFGIRVGAGQVQVGFRGTGDEPIIKANRGVLKDGAIAVTVFCDPPEPHVQVGIGGLLHVSVQNPTLSRRKAPAGQFIDLPTDIGRIINKLINALGHQDDPISP